MTMRLGWSWTRGQSRERRIPEVSGEELARWLSQARPVQVLDIRDAAAFQSGHLTGALHLPLDRLEHDWQMLDPGLAAVVY
jgi:rhodanese-related sulfurtransferase